MNSEYSWRQILLRCVLAFAVLIWPITGIPMPLSPFALVIGAVLAYHGVTRGSLLWCFVFLLSAEWIYDIGAGVLTVSYMVCAITMVGLRRWLSVTPFAGEVGWPLGPLVRTILFGSFLAVLSVLISTAISAGVHGNGAFAQRIVLQFADTSMLAVALGIMTCSIVVLARIDRPWRRPITYGI